MTGISICETIRKIISKCKLAWLDKEFALLILVWNWVTETSHGHLIHSGGCVSKTSERRLTWRKKSLGFDFSVVWMEPQNHFDDCYFYLVNLSGYRNKTKHMNIWNLPFVLACLMTEKSVMVCCLQMHNILVIRTLKINLLVANLFPCYSHTQSWIT